MITTMTFYDRRPEVQPEQVVRSVVLLEDHEQAAGVRTNAELQVYRSLKAAPARTEREIAQRTRLPEVAVRKAMQTLMGRGTVRQDVNNLGVGVFKTFR